MKRIIFLLIAVISKPVFSQDLSFSKKGNKYYKELPDPAHLNIEVWSMPDDDCYVSFADDNVRYPKKSLPDIEISDKVTLKAWKGEKVHTKILVWTKEAIPELSFSINDFENKSGEKITADHIKPAFVRYVMADEYGGGCTKRKASDLDSSLVEDPVDIIEKIPVEPYSVQPVWVSIEVPRNIPAGKYEGILTIDAGEKYDLTIALDIINRTLPPPEEWKFDLDLWQYPAPIARIHDIELWSDEHFNLMREYFSALAKAGQKVITANIIDQPWGNDHVHFDDPGLIKWIKKQDGSWDFDYSIFDKYISFIMSCGIRQRINCYSMVTWDLSFSYYDEAKGENVSFKAEPGSKEYEEYWKTMLTDFTGHLKSKGWFGITAIAMDERPLESMQVVISILKSIDPGWRIALAGDSYHPEITEDIYDYSIASYLQFDDDVLVRRKERGMPSTFYTACKERHLAPYTFAPPAENAWIGWFAAAKGYTGYLFWAYNTWVKDPLRDSRFNKWPSGTCYQFYPGPRTSIRFEKLTEGIQDFEKIRILREEFSQKNQISDMQKLDEILSSFKIEKLDTIPAEYILKKAKEQLNTF